MLLEEGGFGFELIRKTITSYRRLPPDQMPQGEARGWHVWAARGRGGTRQLGLPPPHPLLPPPLPLCRADGDAKMQRWVIQQSWAAGVSLVPYYRGKWRWPITEETAAALQDLPAYGAPPGKKHRLLA